VRGLVVGLVAAAAVCGGASARAQTATPAGPGSRAPRLERVEVSAGASWLGGYELGARDAVLTGNAGTSGGQVVLFRTASDVSGSPGVDVRVGIGLTHGLVADAAFAYGQPELQTRISGDFEQAADVTVADTIAQYVVEGALRFHLTGWAGARRAVSPFVSGGAGYLRQLASRAATVEDGLLVHGGGGVAWRLGGSPRGTLRGYGVRVDARVNWRASGIDVEDAVRVYPSAGASLYLRF